MNAIPKLKLKFKPRVVLTPEGLFIYDRTSGLCAFTPEVRSKTWVKPLYAQIALTEKCNQRCPFCYLGSSPEKTQEWRLDELKELVGFLDSWGLLGVAFGGGEPFMYPHLAEVAEWTWHNTGLDVSVTTNGTAASERQIRKLEGCVSEVRVSIRTPETCGVLKKFLNRKFELGVNLLLFRGNADALEEIVRGSMRLGVKDFLINSFLPVGRGAEHEEWKPGREDFARLGNIIEKFKGKATFKVSGGLGADLKKQAKFKFIPFEDERRGRIIAITADRKVKPSSLVEEAYPFRRTEEILSAYYRLINNRRQCISSSREVKV